MFLWLLAANIACAYAVNFVDFTTEHLTMFEDQTGKPVRYSHQNAGTIRVRQFNHTCEHAESPVWDSDKQVLYWVDVLKQRVHALDYNTGEHKIKQIEYGEVNIVHPIQNSSRLLVGVRAALYLLDFSIEGDKAIRLLTNFDHGMPDNILNEGKIDAVGRFWGGTKGPQSGNDVAADRATFYSVKYPDFLPLVELRPVTISNGLVWSVNNTVLYYIDSEKRQIEAFDFDLKRGILRNRRTIIKLNNYEDIFAQNVIADGMTIDKDGCLWVALMFGGAVIRIDPDSRTIISYYKFLPSKITSVAWCGPALDQLIVTTSRRNQNRREADATDAGTIYVVENLGTSGVPSHKFYFPGADKY